METPSKPLRAAVIGLGETASQHLDFLSYSKLVELVAVCDPSPALGDFVQKKYGCAAVYTDNVSMFDQGGIDVVHILSPLHTHHDQIARALEADAHVITNTPLAATTGDLEELLLKARKSKLQLVEEHHYRFSMPYQKLISHVERRAIGAVTEVEARFNINTNETSLTAPHQLQQTDNAPARLIRNFLPHLLYLTHPFLPHIDSLNTLWRQLAHPNSADDLTLFLSAGRRTAHIRFTTLPTPNSLSISVTGDRGKISCELCHPMLQLEVPRWGKSKLSPAGNLWANGWEQLRACFGVLTREIIGGRPHLGVHSFLEQTYRALQEGKTAPVTSSDMLRVSQLMDRLFDQEGSRCEF